MGDLELVELVLVCGVEAEGYEGEALAFSFAKICVGRVISPLVQRKGPYLRMTKPRCSKQAAR